MSDAAPAEGGAVVPGPELPLAGVRVLDLILGPMGAVGRMLAELGADVIRIEPRHGGADREQGPRVGGISLSFSAANLGKRGLALDLDVETDREVFYTLIASADILLENSCPGSPEADVLSVASICARNPALVVLAVSDFGAGNSFSSWRAPDPVLQALNGQLSRSGQPDCAPLLPPGDLAIQCAAGHAVFVTLAAYLNRLQFGFGDHLDLSLLDASSQALDPGYGSSGTASQGIPASKLPRGRPAENFRYPIIRCADGFVRLCILAPRQWQGLFDWLGRPEEFADPIFRTVRARYKSSTLIPCVAAFFANKTRAELEAAGQERGVPIAAVLSVEEALGGAHLKARRALTSIQIATGVSLEFPNGFIEVDGRRSGAVGPPPELAQHQGEILEQILTAQKVAEPFSDSRERKLPLQGLKVIDLGVVVVGAEQGRLLADLGADVIRVENTAFPNSSRQTRGDEKISVNFAAGHRNMRSLGLNLRAPEGKALFLKLVEQADVVLSNFKPGTLESLDLSSETLLALFPRLIVAESSGFGPTGPESRRMGYGPLVRAAAGLSLQWRYPDDPASFSDAITVYPDHVSGRAGVAGVLALLVRRLRTGGGGVVSVSQTEVMLSHMSAQVASATATSKGLSVENGDGLDAPWGVFPCAGNDEWCVVAVRTDAEWLALCNVMGRSDLREDSMLAYAAGRASQRARIDAAVSEWLGQRGPQDAMRTLQANGVPAGAMSRVADLPSHPYFVERGFFRLSSHPNILEPFFAEKVLVRSARLADPPNRPAPLAGEHTLQIVRDELGLDSSQIEQFLSRGILEASHVEVLQAAAAG